MEYNKLIAVTGLSGLFELVSSKNDGAVVRSVEDKSTKFVSNRQHSFSHLDSIEVYTNRDNVNLAEVFQAMAASSEALPSSSDAAAIKQYFSKVYPDMDFTRVYASDMKKMVRWFEILTKNNIEITRGSEDSAEAPVEKAPEKTEKKPAPARSTAAASTKSAPAKKVNAPRKMA